MPSVLESTLSPLALAFTLPLYLGQKLLGSGETCHNFKSSDTCTCDIQHHLLFVETFQELSTLGFRVKMAAAGAAMGFGKKAALAAAGLFSGVGGAVAYKLDQVIPTDNREEKLKVDV